MWAIALRLSSNWKLATGNWKLKSMARKLKSDKVLFLASGASIRLVGPGSVTRAVIDNGDGSITGADTDIKTNGADVTSPDILQNGNLHVLVEVSIADHLR